MAGDICLPLTGEAWSPLQLLLPYVASAIWSRCCCWIHCLLLTKASCAGQQLMIAQHRCLRLLMCWTSHTHGQDELQGKQACCCSVEKAPSSRDQQRRRLVIQPRWIAVMIAFIIPGSKAKGTGQQRRQLDFEFLHSSKPGSLCPNLSAQQIP